MMAFPQRIGIPQPTFVTGFTTQIPLNFVVQAPTYTLIPTHAGILTSVGMPPRQQMRPHHHVQQPRRDNTPREKPPITTVFMGNINEKAPNDLVRTLFQKCGHVSNWRRIQDPQGKVKAFGYCDFELPESTLRALRVLNEFPIGAKRLVVKVDDKVKRSLLEYFNKLYQRIGKAPMDLEGELPEPDPAALEDDKVLKKQLEELVAQHAEELKVLPGEEEAPPVYRRRGNLNEVKMDATHRAYVEREINQFREAYKETDEERKKREERNRLRAGRDRGRNDFSDRNRERDREREALKAASGSPVVEDDRRRKRDRSRSPSAAKRPGSAASRSSSLEARRAKRRRTPSASPTPAARRSSRDRDRGSRDRSSRDRGGAEERRDSRQRSKSPQLDSSEEEEAAEEEARKKAERKAREKEISYQERLRKWEDRERRKQKEYAKEKAKEKEKRKADAKEAKKLIEFLEDYDDERDDPKYYKGTGYTVRRKEYEREREADARDRKKEKEEIEEIRQRLLSEGHDNPDREIRHLQKLQEEAALACLRPRSGSSSSSRSRSSSPGQADAEEDGEENAGRASAGTDGGAFEVGETAESTPKESSFRPADGVPETAKPIGFGTIKLAQNVASAPATAVFGEDDESADKAARKKLVPLEYTEEEKQQQPLTADDKKRMIKQIIERIPTTKEDLFAYAIEWDAIDESLLNKRVRPWVTKKIIEYIGEEEPSLVDFICKNVMKRSAPTKLLEDIQIILEDEAEVFVVKMWRLLIYEVEAKKKGLVKPED